MTVTDREWRDPLDMAVIAVRNAQVIGETMDELEKAAADEGKQPGGTEAAIKLMQARQARPGKQTMDALDLAARLALVSVAQDLRRIADCMRDRA